jgi:hypothetical protein
MLMLSVVRLAGSLGLPQPISQPLISSRPPSLRLRGPFRGHPRRERVQLLGNGWFVHATFGKTGGGNSLSVAIRQRSYSRVRNRPLRAWGIPSGDGFPIVEGHEK